MKVGNLTIYSAPPPGSGAIMTFIINVLRQLIPVNNEHVFWQRSVETFKWAYARRTELGDPDFVEGMGEIVIPGLLLPDVLKSDLIVYLINIINIIKHGK